MKDSQFNLRKIAAALYGIHGVDATKEQIDNARKAQTWYNEGKPMAYILLMLRIKRKVPEAPLMGGRAIDVSE